MTTYTVGLTVTSIIIANIVVYKPHKFVFFIIANIVLLKKKLTNLLSLQNNKVFKNILDDVFTGLPDAPPPKNTFSARSRGMDVELALKQKAVEKGLSAHEPWISRCKQLYETSQVYHGKICLVL